MKQEGKVTVVSEVDFHGTMLHSFQIEGSKRWWRMGKIKPEFKEGEWVEFEEKNGYVVGDVQQSTATSGSESSTESVFKAGDVGQRLQYQAARADATRLVVAALHTDHLPHAANVAKNKRLDLLTGYVERVTQTLLEQENNDETK